MKFRRLILANLLRKKVRLLLTLGSFTVALFLFAFLAVVREAFTRGGSIASANRLVTINRVSIIQPLPLSYRDKIARIQGVQYVTHFNWFGGVYQDEKNFFPQFAIDPENQRKVIPELVVPGDQWSNFLKDRQGAIVGAGTAERFGWKIGDRIPIKAPPYLGGGAWQFNIDGIYHGQRRADDESQFWFQWDYFKERVPDRMKGLVGWYEIKLASPDDALRVAKEIDTEFANSPYETKTDTESQFAANWVNQFGNIKFLILSIGSVVFFTLLLVTGNTMAISVRERTGELAILKAIGFKDRSVLFMVLAEALAIALAGGLLGLGLAIVAIPALGVALNGLLPNLILSKSMLAVGIGFALSVGALSGLLPGIGAMRLSVVNALRRI
jgi:putative ABC transport system permease protein